MIAHASQPIEVRQSGRRQNISIGASTDVLPVQFETEFRTAALPDSEQRHFIRTFDFWDAIEPSADFQTKALARVNRRADVMQPF